MDCEERLTLTGTAVIRKKATTFLSLKLKLTFLLLSLTLLYQIPSISLNAFPLSWTDRLLLRVLPQAMEESKRIQASYPDAEGQIFKQATFRKTYMRPKSQPGYYLVWHAIMKIWNDHFTADHFMPTAAAPIGN